jgi:hypothetical protein
VAERCAQPRHKLGKPVRFADYDVGGANVYHESPRHFDCAADEISSEMPLGAAPALQLIYLKFIAYLSFCQTSCKMLNQMSK